jgi:hypothetical protein
MKSEGKRFPLKIANETKLIPLYSKKIDNLLEEHKEILLDVEFMVTNNMIFCKLENFIESRLWLEIRKERKQLIEIKHNEKNF